MIIIPGIAKSGTSYLTKKIHEAGVKMYKERDEHYEDKLIAGSLRKLFVSNFGSDKWFFDKDIPGNHKKQKEIDDIKFHCDFNELQGFKNPRLIHFLPELIHTFPEAKFVICYRNLFDWINSNAKHGRKGLKWEKDLRSHWLYCTDLLRGHINKNVFIFWYDIGDNAYHQWKLMEFLGFVIDMSDFKPHYYE